MDRQIRRHETPKIFAVEKSYDIITTNNQLYSGSDNDNDNDTTTFGQQKYGPTLLN